MAPVLVRASLVDVALEVDAQIVRRTRSESARELALLVLLYVGYSAARLAADADQGTAMANARDLLHVEAALHIEVERWANSLVTGIPWLALASSYWYSLLHYVVTPGVLLWVYHRRPALYRGARNALALGSAVGIAGFVLLPMAPPRMLPGYVDTLAATSGHGWWGSNASAPRGLGGLTNELAAMPSLHVGWALWCTWVVFLCCQHRSVRILAVAYTAGTTMVVVATANHYVLDVIAGSAVIALGFSAGPAAARRPGRASRRPRPPGTRLGATGKAWSARRRYSGRAR